MAKTKYNIPDRVVAVSGAALIFILTVFFFIFRTPEERKVPGVAEPFMVRVRLAHNARQLKLGAQDPILVEDANTGEVFEARLAPGKGKLISPVKDGVSLAGKVLPASSISIIPSSDSGIELNGTVYRGEIDIINTGKRLDAVNRVDMEDYLKGVVPREMNSLWPFEALKAQAIASRSFAVYEALRREKKDYDLTADTFSQVYGGMSAEKRRASKAVEATGGKVLGYKGKVLPAYFHSCCGGHTEDASAIWGKGIPPLEGVKCPWCRWSPYFRWQVKISTRSVLNMLNARGYHIKSIDDIEPGTRDGSGRLEQVSIRSGNKWIEMNTGDLRAVLGRSAIKSANFHVRRYPTFYLFSGYGWGHGVGMCQWGAFGLAFRWKSAEWILGHYYPGARIVELGEVGQVISDT